MPVLLPDKFIICRVRLVVLKGSEPNRSKTAFHGKSFMIFPLWTGIDEFVGCLAI